jgi:two-component system, NtrC family, response regulator PilR
MAAERDRDFRVLLCEDDPGVRRLIAVILERAGIKVDTAEDGEAGLAQILAHEPDLIVLDLMMPRVSGLEVISWLKENRPQLLPRTVVVTAAANATVTALESEKICNIIRKPFDIEEFRQIIFACRDRSPSNRAA